ncbi:hypothetical protein ABZO31_21475 [Streptomyces sp. HUAS MG47]|uniref:hypothetical protein n=1 Tax=Streptomyces solicamelliae TaxID=3231716 RepID=UPI003878400A
MNSSMRSLWREPLDVGYGDLPVELRDLVDQGWKTGPAGALLLGGMHGDGWRDDWSPGEVARHEIDVNDVWVPPTGLDEDRDVFLPGMVARARGFLACAVEAASGFEAADRLVGVISVGIDDDYLEHGTTVKLLTRRGGFPDYFEDLERFVFEGMAVVDAADV